MLFSTVFIAFLLRVSVSEGGNIDNELMRTLQLVSTSDVLVDFDGGNARVIDSINSQRFSSRISKVTALTTRLKSLARDKQGSLQDFLKAQRVQHTSFWSSNQMIVRGAGLQLVERIAKFRHVSNVQVMPKVYLKPVPSTITPNADEPVQWGVATIRADQVWKQLGTRGEGVVVANIDTGVLGTHEALQGNWRSDHGWFDPYDKSSSPNDGNGHGTHTMGTIAGGKEGIGVAPGAQWIACRGCGSDSCSSEELLACGQWMLEPTNPDGTDPDKSKTPDVVSNSWGGFGYRNWYNQTIDAWTAAGIMSVFAIGNSGPFCASTGSPGSQLRTFSVGSTDRRDRLSVFSSKGPAGQFSIFGFGHIKPEVSAPGSDITSAWYTSDTAYNTISGTSMACPHVAGTMALMLSAYRKGQNDSTVTLDQFKVVSILEETAVKTGLTLGRFNPSCPFYSSPSRFPNNMFGYGRVDALCAVNATMPNGEALSTGTECIR